MPLIKIFLLFLRLGAFTFGGGIVMMGLLERELRETDSFEPGEIMDMMVFATAFPGPLAVNIALLAGRKMAGRIGAATAVAGTVLPPFLTILLLAKILLLFMTEPPVRAFFLGAACAVAVIIGGVVYNMTRIAFSGGWKDMAVFALVAVVLLGFGLHPFAALASGAVLRLALGEDRAP